MIKPIYAKSEFTRESLFLFIFFLNRIDSRESSDASFLGPAAIKQK